jgi:hypothetical protein
MGPGGGFFGGDKCRRYGASACQRSICYGPVCARSILPGALVAACFQTPSSGSGRGYIHTREPRERKARDVLRLARDSTAFRAAPGSWMHFHGGDSLDLTRCGLLRLSRHVLRACNVSKYLRPCLVSKTPTVRGAVRCYVNNRSVQQISRANHGLSRTIGSA